EIGPRALGNRSLIAAPFTKETHARLNRIKKREGFRPIAPILMEEELDRLYHHNGPSPHMLYFQRAKTDALQAVTHVDGTARVQTVTRGQNVEMYALLDAFRARTGYGVLCNTSLNFNGKGFINRLSDLVRYARGTGLDGFVVGETFYGRT
ncbi:MAG: carbamoyltransferase C-terminal domain-containing protein, partial [Rhizobiaceae bacterium]